MQCPAHCSDSMSEGNSYARILRSSSIMGGARAVNYALGLVRVKVIAVLLGPIGVGIIGLYTSATTFVGTLTSLGISKSAVRSVAEANGRGDPVAVANVTRSLRYLCWITGIIGWLACIVLARPLSELMFESSTHAWALAILGATLFMSALSEGQNCLLQGLRRIGDIARVQVASATLSTAVAIALYVWLGERGIVPALLAGGAVSLAMSWWFTRRIEIAAVRMSWKMAATEAKPLLGLGIAMTWAAVIAALVDLYTRSLISQELGVDATGIFHAAWALSGAFAGFVLGAMGVDFYPRLTATIHNATNAVREVNEQTEIGILLTLPGLLLIVAFAKWIVWALYSADFAPAAEVLVWMVLSMFGQVISWPLSYVQLAAGAGRWYAITEATLFGVQLVLVTSLVPRFGVLGAAYAFALSRVVFAGAMALVAHHLITFRWSKSVWRMMSFSMILITAALVANQMLPSPQAVLTGALIAVVGGVWCAIALASRLGPAHPLTRVVVRILGARRLSGL